MNDGRTNFVKKIFNERFNPDEEYLGRDKPVNNLKPLLSVCVPTYQHESFIAECLDSILMQKTNFPFEILVGEDESKDNTRVICKEYAEKHPNKIRLFLRDRKTSQLYDENGEFLFRFNIKWLRLSSRGKYIAICEGDDYWTFENKLQMQVDFLETHPDYSMCFHNAKVIYSGKPDAYNFVEITEGEYNGIDLYKKWLVPTASVVFKAKCIKNKDHIFNSNFYFGDLVVFLTLAECGKIWFFDKSMSVYRKHQGGMMHNVIENAENIRKFIIHQKQIIQTFPNKYRKTGYKHISWFYFVLFRVTFRKDIHESILSLFKSFSYSPKRFSDLLIKLIQTRFKSTQKR